MNFFQRRAPQVAALVVLTTCPSGQVRSTRYERRKCTHMGWHDEVSYAEVYALREEPSDEHRRGYLDAEQASWDNFGRHPDSPLGLIHRLGD